MRLVFGTPVIENHCRIGQLAALEVNPVSRRVTHVLITWDDALFPRNPDTTFASTLDRVLFLQGHLQLEPRRDPSSGSSRSSDPIVFDLSTRVHVGEHQFPLAGMMITQRETGDILAALIRKGSLKKLFRIAFTHPDLRSTGEIHLPASEKICPDVDEPVGIV